MSSKEIARSTGLAPASVDTYLKQAMAALGVNNRRDAARVFANAATSQKLGSPPGELPPPALPLSSVAPVGRRRIWLPLPPMGGQERRYSWGEKTQHILQIAVLFAALMVGLTLTIAGFYRILR